MLGIEFFFAPNPLSATVLPRGDSWHLCQRHKDS